MRPNKPCLQKHILTTLAMTVAGIAQKDIPNLQRRTSCEEIDAFRLFTVGFVCLVVSVVLDKAPELDVPAHTQKGIDIAHKMIYQIRAFFLKGGGRF
jgi:hypothetical protein